MEKLFFLILATGIARSVSPGQGLRNLVYTPSGFSPAGTTTAARDPSWSSQGLPESSSSPQVLKKTHIILFYFLFKKLINK